MKREIEDYIRDIVDSIAKAMEFVKDMAGMRDRFLFLKISKGQTECL